MDPSLPAKAFRQVWSLEPVKGLKALDNIAQAAVPKAQRPGLKMPSPVPEPAMYTHSELGRIRR